MRRILILTMLSGLCLFMTGRLQLTADDNAAAQYNTKDADLAKQEAESLAELADWCRQKELPNQAYRLATRVVTLQPQNALANSVLDQLRREVWRPRNSSIKLLLVDGSHLRGTADLRQVTLNSEYGMLSFPVRQVQLVVFNFVNGKDLVMADGFSMIGDAGIGTFPMETKVGRVNAEETNLKQLQIIRPCETCSGKLKVSCMNCQGKGVVSVEKSCPTCKGDPKKECPTCEGKGTITCNQCDGRGQIFSRGGRRGMPRMVTCPRCKGKGEVPCADCRGSGTIVCPTCKGTGSISEMESCPVCHGTKIIPCPACNGTGEQSAPKPVWPIPPEADPEAPAEPPAPAAAEAP